MGADPRPVLEVEAGVGGQVGGGRLGRPPRAQPRILLLQGARQHQRVTRPTQAELKKEVGKILVPELEFLNSLWGLETEEE